MREAGRDLPHFCSKIHINLLKRAFFQGVEPNPNLTRKPIKIAFFFDEPEPFKFEIIKPEQKPNL